MLKAATVTILFTSRHSICAASLIAALALPAIPDSAKAIELPRLTGPDNFWECILENVPGSSYSYEYQKRVRACEKDFPLHERIEKDTRGGSRIYNRPKVKECIAKYSAGTVLRKAKLAIRVACQKVTKEN